jgi:hypothetical protein
MAFSNPLQAAAPGPARRAVGTEPVRDPCQPRHRRLGSTPVTTACAPMRPPPIRRIAESSRHSRVILGRPFRSESSPPSRRAGRLACGVGTQAWPCSSSGANPRRRSTQRAARRIAKQHAAISTTGFLVQHQAVFSPKRNSPNSRRHLSQRDFSYITSGVPPSSNHPSTAKPARCCCAGGLFPLTARLTLGGSRPGYGAPAPRRRRRS